MALLQTEKHVCVSPNADSFTYLHREAKNTNAPLLILLHGYGSNEADLFSFRSHIPDGFHVVSLQAPMSIGEGYAWFPIHFTSSIERWTNPEEVTEAVTYIQDFIRFYSSKASFDPAQVYLLGFSQGAMLSYAVGLKMPYVKGIAALSGYIDTRVVKLENSSIDSIYVSHGTADMVVPYSWAVQSVETLKDYGLTPEFYSYPQGHGINQENLSSLIQWLVNQL